MSARSLNSPGWRQAVRGWFDAAALEQEGTRADAGPEADRRVVDWPRVVPYVLVHAGCLAVFLVGFSPIALAVAAALYAVRMFAITGFYHRYFSHRSFRTSRPMQFLFALVGASAVQRGACWWAAHHRDHHRHAETERDAHSPRRHGFWWSHVGWFLSRPNFRTRWENIPDLGRYPELRFLDRHDILVPVLLAASLFGLGELLAAFAPGLGTSGWQLLVWGFFVSTVVLHHASFTINSVAHRVGRRRFATTDDSRNSLVLALLTLGEGWHNNHHRFPGTVRQGLRWWEVDVTYYVLRLMQACGLIWELAPAPSVRTQRRAERQATP